MKKNETISCLQSFGIILVVIGHSFYGSQNMLYTWIYSFHMPLFMWISGYLLYDSMKYKGYTVNTLTIYQKNLFIIKKAKRLLIPYICISTFAFFPKAFLSSFAHRPIDLSLSSYIHMLLYPWDNVIIFFWFLPTLFIIFAIVIYASHPKITHSPIFDAGLILFLALIHIWNPLDCVKLFNLQGVISYLVYFFAGYFFCCYNLQNKIRDHAIYIFIISFTFSWVIIQFSYIEGLDIITAFNGIIMAFALCCIYTNNKWSFFSHLYGASFTIYLLSWFPQVLCQQILTAVANVPWYITTFMSFIFGLYIPLGIYKWCYHHKNHRIGKHISHIIGI